MVVFFFSPNQTNQGLFWQVSGLVLSPNTPKEPCSTVSLQQSWLSSHPSCQRTDDPGSRAEQAPRQQEHRAAGKESKVWDHRSTDPRTAANSHRDTDWVTLGLLCKAACPTAAWYTLVSPGQELIPPLPSQRFLFKIFSFQTEASQQG